MKHLIVAVTAGWLAFGQGQQRPTFRSATELALIDTQVVARDGTPILGLKPEQFEVFIDGRKRPVVSAEFVRAVPADAAPGPSNAAAPSAAAPGRIVVMAIDQGSFPIAGTSAAREAATRVAEQVAQEDYLGMIAFPGDVDISPSRDRAPIREAIAKISGSRPDPGFSSKFRISAAEATILKSNDGRSIREITDRECRSNLNPMDMLCPREVVGEGSAIADLLEAQALFSLDGLHHVMDLMAPLPGRKTLIVISAGLPMSNRPGARPNLDIETDRIARRAAAANVSLYVLYMNVHFLRYFSAAYGKRNYSVFEDINVFGTGLERFADTGGGAFFQVDVDANRVLDRVMRETSAVYLVAVQPEPAEYDGRDHFIRLEVKQRGATVRYRRILRIEKR